MPRKKSKPNGEEQSEFQISRRGLLGLAGAGLAGIGIGVAGDEVVRAVSSAPHPGELSYDFYGTHQAGVITPAQDRLHFASFDVAPGMTRSDVIELLQDWTIASAAMTAGKEIGQNGAGVANYDAPPEDTGEAFGLATSGLTITFGFGPTLFVDSTGVDRFGISSQQPSALKKLPHFPADDLNAVMSDGDLCIQACANDPQVAVHAIRNLTRIAFGRAVLKWSQLGYGRTSSTSTTQKTERNLFGFKDGTNNIKAEDTTSVNKHVWVTGAPTWLDGGTYLVARRIRMTLETWDRAAMREQENVFGRTKNEGGPLSGGTEYVPANFEKTNSAGKPLIDPTSHMSLAAPAHNNGITLLRRGYNFVDGNDELGRLNAGLFFISFQNDPQNFITVQSKLAKNDLMNEYVKHVGSGLWAVPPGIQPGSFVGASLFLA
jgi:deferrochelatase/peroxidase EfeB